MAVLLLGFATAESDDIAAQALANDAECDGGAEACALNALQLKGAETDEDEGEVADEADEEEDEEEVEGQEGEAQEELQEEDAEVAELHNQLLSDTSGRRRKSQCCLCKGGTVSWSASGTCSHCHKIKKRVTPKKKCQVGNSKFVGSSRCANMCKQSFPHAQGGYPSGGYPSGGYHGGGYPSGGSHGAGMCNTATSGTCSMFGCSKSRGPVDCMKGKCVCKPGACSNGNACHVMR